MNIWLRMILITMTVGGGFMGIALSMQTLFSPQVSQLGLIAIGVAFVLLNLFVLISGLLFVHNPQRVMPLVVALAFQIPVITSPIFAYRFGTGLEGGVGLTQEGSFAWIHLGSNWQLNLLQPLPWGLGINLIAVLVLIALGRSMRRQHQSMYSPAYQSPQEITGE